MPWHVESLAQLVVRVLHDRIVLLPPIIKFMYSETLSWSPDCKTLSKNLLPASSLVNV